MQRCDKLSAGGSFNGITANSNQTKTEPGKLCSEAFKQRLSQRVLVKGEEQKEIHVGLLQVKQR